MSTLTARSAPRTILGLLAALGLVAALTMPALAGAPETDWATVDDYAPHSPENNEAATWGAGCVKLPSPDNDTYLLPELAEGKIYTRVVVKAGSDQSTEEGANTIFDFPAAGETVWADAVADGVYGDGDKMISHMIICTGDEAEESQAQESQAEESQAEESQAEESQAEESQAAESQAQASASVREDTQGGNPTPSGGTLPDTAVGQFGQIPATVLSLVLMGALAATVYVRLARQR